MATFTVCSKDAARTTHSGLFFVTQVSCAAMQVIISIQDNDVQKQQDSKRALIFEAELPQQHA